MTYSPVSPGVPRSDDDEVRRYRPAEMYFDMRATTLRQVPTEEWDAEARLHYEQNVRELRADLESEFGSHDAQRKLEDFIALGPTISILSVHTRFLIEARAAFVIGAHYPALTAACALGERLLNQLILRMRDSHFADHTATRHVKKNATDNWGKAIQTLAAWGVLTTELQRDFRMLHRLRNDAIHFNLPELQNTGARSLALDAVRLIQQIVERLLPAFGTSEHFIPGTSGMSVLRRAAEADPLVVEFIIPACVLVSPDHRYNTYDPSGATIIVDNVDYATESGRTSLSDEEFASLLG